MRRQGRRHRITKSLAHEVGSRNITVNAGGAGIHRHGHDPGTDRTTARRAACPHPARASRQAEEIAHAVAFLASPRAAYVTGTTLHVNGGMYMN